MILILNQHFISLLVEDSLFIIFHNQHNSILSRITRKSLSSYHLQQLLILLNDNVNNYADDSDGYSVYGTGSRGQSSRSTGTPGGMRRSNSTKCLIDRTISGNSNNNNNNNNKTNTNDRSTTDHHNEAGTAYVIENGVRKRLREIPVTSMPGGWCLVTLVVA